MNSVSDSTSNVKVGGGWFGQLGQLLHTLRVMRADTDEQGSFLVRGTIVRGMGQSGDNADMVVGADAQYMAAGTWHGLAAALNGTSYGLHDVTVI